MHLLCEGLWPSVTVKCIKDDFFVRAMHLRFFPRALINVASSRLNKREEVWSLMWNAIRY